jgi:outer membrane protein assembly factor BamA
LSCYLNNGTLVPFTAALVQETTKFAEFGPLSGSTFNVGFEVSPQIGSTLSRYSFSGDLRKYLRLGSTSSLLALRFKGFYSSGNDPAIFYFGGNQELRGYQYLGFVGSRGFFSNVELRLPLINLAATPIGIIGPIRGTFYFGIGGASFGGDNYQFGTSNPGISYVKDPIFGEPVSGFHLVDGRASFGMGLQLFFLGYPLHFDWTKFTDLKVVSDGWKFDFWIGYDF